MKGAREVLRSSRKMRVGMEAATLSSEVAAARPWWCFREVVVESEVDV